MFFFKPAIWRNGVLHQLPRPVHAIRVQDSWDFQKFKVPLLNGDDFAGASQNGVDLSVEGQIGSQSGQLCMTEAEMFSQIEQLRTVLQVSNTNDRYTFFLYHDDTTGTYRSFKGCTTVRFEYDLSDPHLFTYSLVMHATDPMIHTTAPVLGLGSSG